MTDRGSKNRRLQSTCVHLFTFHAMEPKQPRSRKGTRKNATRLSSSASPVRLALLSKGKRSAQTERHRPSLHVVGTRVHLSFWNSFGAVHLSMQVQ